MSASPLDRAMLEALQAVATPEEINVLIVLFDDMSRGHVEKWQVDFIYEIIKRLAKLSSINEPA